MPAAVSNSAVSDPPRGASLASLPATGYRQCVTRYDRRTRALAACLSALAGFVDALAFIALGGFFVSFMSGNSTRLGVGLAEAGHHALIAAGLVLTFLIGVVLGSVVGDRVTQRRSAVLTLVTALLAAAAMFSALGDVRAAIACMALAMGAENAVFEREGEVSIGLTYMTGTLVKAGQRIAAALRGGDRWSWGPYLMLWASLVAGAGAGAAIYPRLGLGGLWIAAAWATACTLAAARMERNRP